MASQRCAAWVGVFLCGAVALAGSAQQRRASTPEERELALQLIRQLETSPLSKSAPDSRQWLTFWLGQVSDVAPKTCDEMLKPLEEEKREYAADVQAQVTFSSAGFILQNPAKARDDAAVLTAGLEGALRAYEAIARARPKAKSPFLDSLVTRRARAELPAYVREAMAKCQ